MSVARVHHNHGANMDPHIHLPHVNLQREIHSWSFVTAGNLVVEHNVVKSGFGCAARKLTRGVFRSHVKLTYHIGFQNNGGQPSG